MASRLTSLQLGGTALVTLAAGIVGYFAGNVTVTQTLTAQNLTATGTVLAATVKATTAFSGASLTIDKTGSSGSGKIVLFGYSGSFICLWDKDHAGYTQISALNGVLISNTASPATCP